MKKYLLVLSNYTDYRKEFFEKYISVRNKEYCKIHNYEYIEINNFEKIRDKYGWVKPFKINELIETFFLKENDKLLCLDADILIVKPELEFPVNKSFTYSIDTGNTHCMGAYSITINEWTKRLFKNIISEERYNKLKDKQTIHERFKNYSSFWDIFYDQASWYSLAGIKRHSDIPFKDLKDFGWHSDKNEDTVYSLEELYENIEILNSNWNVTEFVPETGGTFYINKVKKEDVILRHFAGGQKWREEWYNNI